MLKDYDPYTPISPLTILDFKKGSTALSKDGITANNVLLNQVMDLRSAGRLNDYLFRIRAYGDQGQKGKALLKTCIMQPVEPKK